MPSDIAFLSIPNDLRTNPFPLIETSKLFGRDKDIGFSIQENLREIYTQSVSYNEALLLHVFSSAWVVRHMQSSGDQLFNTVWPHWSRMGVEGAVISARNYSKALNALSTLGGAIDGWRDAIDCNRIKAAKRELQRRFPQVDGARDAISDQEYYANPDKKMAPKGAEAGFVRTSHGSGEFAASFDGRRVTCEVTREGGAFIVANANDVFASFDRIEQRKRTA